MVEVHSKGEPSTKLTKGIACLTEVGLKQTRVVFFTFSFMPNALGMSINVSQFMLEGEPGSRNTQLTATKLAVWSQGWKKLDTHFVQV